MIPTIHGVRCQICYIQCSCFRILFFNVRSLLQLFLRGCSSGERSALGHGFTVTCLYLGSDNYFNRSFRGDNYFNGSSSRDIYFKGSARRNNYFKGSSRTDNYFNDSLT